MDVLAQLKTIVAGLFQIDLMPIHRRIIRQIHHFIEHQYQHAGGEMNFTVYEDRGSDVRHCSSNSDVVLVLHVDGVSSSRSVGRRRSVVVVVVVKLNSMNSSKYEY